MESKCIILSRVSTVSQHLESQTNDLIKEAIRLGYDREHQVIIEDIESAIKLKEHERMGLQKLKYHIQNDSSIDCVLCWEPSRLARQQKILYSIRDYLVENKIQLYILNPYVKLLTDDRSKIDPTASIVFSLFSTISENEMVLKKERFMRAKNELTQQGKKSAGSVIFGYMKDKDKNCIPHPLHSKIVVELFTHYVNHDDTSLYETYQYASKNWPDLFPLLEYKKAQHKIRHLFDTKIYVEGNWCYKSPLISKELWYKAKLKTSQAQCKPRYRSKLQLLGRGKVICGHCGNVMTGCGGNVQAYYCSTDKLHSLQMNIETLEWLIWEEVKVAINIYSSINKSDRVIEINKQINERTNYAEQIKDIINDLNEKQDKLVSLYLDNKVNIDIYNRRFEDTKKDIKLRNEELNRINNEINELTASLKEADSFGDNTIVVDNITEFDIKLEYVRELLDKVVLTKQKDRTISIEFFWLKNLILPHCKYVYKSNGGKRKIFRINEDESEDRIY